MKTVIVAVAVLLLSGCATTEPGKEVGPFVADEPSPYPLCSAVTLTTRPERTQSHYASACRVR